MMKKYPETYKTYQDLNEMIYRGNGLDDLISQSIINEQNNIVKRVDMKVSKQMKVNKPKSKNALHNTFMSSVTTFGGNRNRVHRSLNYFTVSEFLDCLKERHTKNDLDSKPPFSYGLMIFLALVQAPANRLTLSDIYQWINLHFPYFKMSESSWQNSIRHNLSLNVAFRKTIKAPDRKRFLWEYQIGNESKFLKDVKLPFYELKDLIMVINKFFIPVIKIDISKSNKNSINNPLPTPPTINDYSLNAGLAPAFEFNTIQTQPPKQQKQHHLTVSGNTVISDIDATLDALATPKFNKIVEDPIFCSPLTPKKLESIHYSNMVFFNIWNQDLTQEH